MTGQPSGRFEVEKIAFLVALLVLAVAAGIYFARSGGDAGGSAPAAAAGRSVDPLAALRQQTEQNPGEAAAWKALAEEYFNRGQFAEAVPAFEQAARLSPSTAMLWSSLGEARVMASEKDPLPPAAIADFERAQAIDPRDPRSRYFLAVRKDLQGDHDGAIADWLALLRDSPPNAPWTPDLRRTIEQVGKINGIAVAERIATAQRAAAVLVPRAPTVPGPSPRDLAAALAIPPSQQREMAEGMVARLETRLKSQPGNIDGWVMLMRSRMNLGQPDKAATALRDALAANPGQAERLRAAARGLGVQ